MSLKTVSQLDPGQILKYAFDDNTQTLRTQATLHPVGTEIAITQADDSIQATPYRGTFTDYSGATSGSAGTSTQVCAANANRKYFIIQNLDASNAIYINFTSVASTTDGKSLKLIPGGSYVMETSFVTTEVINVCSSGSAIKFAAKEGN